MPRFGNSLGGDNGSTAAGDRVDGNLWLRFVLTPIVLRTKAAPRLRRLSLRLVNKNPSSKREQMARDSFSQPDWAILPLTEQLGVA
jgi:hypothetical protein